MRENSVDIILIHGNFAYVPNAKWRKIQREYLFNGPHASRLSTCHYRSTRAIGLYHLSAVTSSLDVDTYIRIAEPFRGYLNSAK